MIDGRWNRVLFSFFLVITAFACAPRGDSSDEVRGERRGEPRVTLVDPNSLDGRPIEALEPGDSLALALDGLGKGQTVEVFLHDDEENEWSWGRWRADREGRIEPTLFWYQSGVIGTTSREIKFRPDPAFLTFEEAEEFLVGRNLLLSVVDERGRTLIKQKIPVRHRQSPMVYPSNAEGVLVNSFNVEHEAVQVSGRYFPAGATVHLFVVPNQHGWAIGDPVTDITGEDAGRKVETVRLAPGQTEFTAEVWPAGIGRPGAYDIVARIGEDIGPETLLDDDILGYNDDTGIVLFAIINGNIVIESAGRNKGGPAKFEFSDSFEKGEDVWAAVDPTDVPAVHSGGSYAEYVVIDDQPASWYDGATTTWSDVSGGTEIHRVKYWCINASRREIWSNATQTEPIKGYDVIVDFGSTPATSSATFASDGEYTKGIDFVDGYDTTGFWVFEDPSSVGPYAVAEVELNDPNGISGMPFDATGTTAPNYPITLAWGKIKYPATAAGTGQPVATTLSNYPVALFLHGRHITCDNDGSGPGLTGSHDFPSTPPCPQTNRIPNHAGYDYILDRLASQGIVAVSISAHEINFDGGAFNYDARGRLVLKWLDLLKDWSDNGTDPFSGIFNGKFDMTKVALSGHSRGGEGVVAAERINDAMGSPHSIVAVNAIAPTDQQNITSWVPEDAPYLLIVGARDGDVSSMQGFRTYDRAFPEGMANRKEKTVAWVYGANHNYFNTIWTDTAALGSPNPWAGSKDDFSATSPLELTAAEQRQVALTTIAAFFRRHLQGLDPYKEIFTGRLKPSAMVNQHVYWTYQDGERRALDNFEQLPANAASNTHGGTVTATGFATHSERLLNAGSTNYTAPPALPPTDFSFYGDTLGVLLEWTGPATYETEIPAGFRDVSAYSHLTLRAAKKNTTSALTGPGIDLRINIEDGSGNSAMWDLRSEQFDPIPHPYQRGMSAHQSLLTGVRIPLRNFTQNNSGVDLSDIHRVIIKTVGSDTIGLDDIEFGN